jgi:hypothetical protein
MLIAINQDIHVTILSVIVQTSIICAVYYLKLQYLPQGNIIQNYMGKSMGYTTTDYM